MEFKNLGFENIIPKLRNFSILDEENIFWFKNSQFFFHTDCKSKKLKFHIKRMFSDNIKRLKYHQNRDNFIENYPIGFHDDIFPYSIVINSEDSDLQPESKNTENNWYYTWKFSLFCDDYRASDEYILCIDSDQVVIVSRSERGLFYGLITLNKLKFLFNLQIPSCIIKDAPKLHLRTIHIDLKYGIPKASYLNEQAILLSEYKINSFMVEWEDKFPFKNELATLRHPAALSEEDKDRWLEICDLYYIEVFSLVQSLGHFDYVLKHKEFSKLNEMNNIKANNAKEKKEYYSQMCPLNPKVKEFIWKLHFQIYNGMNIHKQSRYIHIGMDETRNLGKCIICSKFVKNNPGAGRSKLYIDHLNWISEKYFSLGKFPIVWNDMIEEEFQLIEEINKSIIICDWEYNHPLPSPKKTLSERVSLLDPTGISVDWVRTRETKTEQQIKENPPPNESIFGSSWWIDNQTYAIRSFPYTKYFKDKGFQVIASPAVQCCGLNPIIPCYAARFPNIVFFNKIASEQNITGSILTNWVVRYAFWPMLSFGFLLHAETSWSGGLISEAEFTPRYLVDYFSIKQSKINNESMDFIKNIHSNLGYIGEEFNKILNVYILNGFHDSHVDLEFIVNQLFPKIEKFKEILTKIYGVCKKNHKYFETLLLTIDYIELFRDILNVAVYIEKIILNYDIEEQSFPFLDELSKHKKKLNKLREKYNNFRRNYVKIISWYLKSEEYEIFDQIIMKPMENEISIVELGFIPFYQELEKMIEKIVKHSYKRFQ